MANLKEVTFGNGSINYVRKFDGRPESTEKNGNVTVHNSPIPGIPGHYQISFMINSRFEQDGVEFSNIFHLNCVVSEQSDHAEYRLVEDQAARQLPPMLRSLADKIEADFPH
jgi:hypothetical protein